MKIKNIAKLSSYGAYIDEEFIYTNSLVEGKNVIVGNIAEYMYDLEQELNRLQSKKSDTAKEILTELLKEENLENVYFTDENGDIRNRQVIRIEKIKYIAEKYGVVVK